MPALVDPDDERRCVATAKGTGERCRAASIHGATVCWKHGGAAPQVREKARIVLAERRALRSIADVEVREITDPLREFATIVAKASAWLDHAAERVAMLEQYRRQDAKGSEHLRAEIVIYERAIDRVGRLLVDWVRLGLDERMVRVSEEQGRMMGELIDRVLDDLGLGDDPRVPAVLDRHLLALGA